MVNKDSQISHKEPKQLSS